MAKKNQIYYPKDNGIFKIVSTRDGLNIPLDYFGHNGYHLILIVKRDENKGETRINYHIKKNGSSDMIINNTLYFQDEQIKFFLENFEKEVRKIYLKYEIIFKDNQYTSQNLYCTACVGENLGINIRSKDGAANMGKLISSELFTEDDIRKKLIEYPICNNPKHNIVYCSKTDEIYIKSIAGILPQNIYYSFVEEIYDLLKYQIDAFESFLQLGIKKYEEKKHMML